MGLTKVKLGKLIELTTEINADNKYGADDVKGMTISKEIIPTKADVSNTDLSKFLVINSGEFVFNPRTHGKKIGFGYNRSTESFIISWNNIGFRVKPDNAQTVLSEYLFLHFNRQEWDREACYRSWGSSTEVFSWDALCEMELVLPPLPVQQKYVAVYRAMCANQQSYERGLEDLKLVCDGYIEELQRKLPAQKIGAYLTQSDERNGDRYGVASVRGLSITKEIIPTKADMAGVPLRSYKVLPPSSIAYVPVTSRNGGKITLAMNRTNDVYILSSSYTVFRTDESRLLPAYLMLFFSRDEFDRYARFHSWGSARETFDWQELCDVEIPIPDITVQESIANIYRVYKERQAINAQLKEQIKSICPILVRGACMEAHS